MALTVKSSGREIIDEAFKFDLACPGDNNPHRYTYVARGHTAGFFRFFAPAGATAAYRILHCDDPDAEVDEFEEMYSGDLVAGQWTPQPVSVIPGCGAIMIEMMCDQAGARAKGISHP